MSVERVCGPSHDGTVRCLPDTSHKRQDPTRYNYSTGRIVSCMFSGNEPTDRHSNYMSRQTLENLSRYSTGEGPAPAE